MNFIQPDVALVAPPDHFSARCPFDDGRCSERGRSIAVSGVVGRPKEGYFGATGGGLWKTTDAGENWAPVTDGQIKSASVGAIAVNESNPDVEGR